MSNQIPGDRLVLGFFSAFRTLVLELADTGSLDLDRYFGLLDETVEAHKSSGDPNRLAAAIAAIRNHISESTNSSQGESH